MSVLLNTVYRVVLGIPVLDISNSFKAYRRSAVEGIVLHSRNFDIIEELLFLVILRSKRADLALRISEIPLTFRRRHAGTSKRELLPFIGDYLRLLLRLLIMKYGQGMQRHV